MSEESASVGRHKTGKKITQQEIPHDPARCYSDRAETVHAALRSHLICRRQTPLIRRSDFCSDDSMELPFMQSPATPKSSATDASDDASLKALRVSESRYRRLFETAQDGILLLNADTAQIEDVNPYLIEMLGYSHAEFLGKKLWEVGSFADIAQSKEMFEVLQTQGYVKYKDLPLKTKAGAKIPVEFVSNSYDCAGIKVIQCNIRNISERKADQAKILRHTQLYSALSQCNKAIVHCTSEEELFLETCRAAVLYGGMKMAWIGFIDNKTRIVRPVASFGDDTGYLKNIDISVDADSPFGRGPSGTAIRENQPFWCQDFLNDPANAPWHERAAQAGWAASASLPLHKEGIVIGNFTLYSGEVNAFDESARNLLLEMASDVSFAFDNFARESRRKQAEQELRIAATAFETQEGIIVTDADKVILRVNQAFTLLTGYSAEEVIGQTPTLLKSGRQSPEFYRRMWKALTIDHFWQGEIWNRRKNGEVHPYWLIISAVTNAEGEITNYVSAYSDLTQYKKHEAAIHSLAYYDPLTNLPNRRLLMDRLQHTFAASARHPNHSAVLFIDLDNFKTLNDTRGHNIGDLLLIEAGNRLQGCIREGDTVARLGGDEFVVILEDLSEKSLQAIAQTEAVCHKMLAAISQPYSLKGYEYRSSASIGISLFHNQEITVDEILKRADAAMYQAKNAGKNTLRFYDPAMQAALETRTALENDLRRALTENQFRLYYQMQVEHSGHILGAEALIRWQHPQRGLVSPVEFIPLAEEMGLISLVGQWVMETACAQLQAWQSDSLTRDLRLAVNVSARQFHQPDFVEQVIQTLNRHALNPERLKLELTESLVLDNIDDTIVKMHAIRKLGVRFSMDDFGTGYSSLSYLTQLPLDQLKIDRSFVRNIGVKHTDAVIVQTIIGMAHNLGMEVIAEGVETEDQRAFLEMHGCALCQGYLFGKPVPVDEFVASLMKP
jgi:diguanylate cyclase (GGDEF)-like protein/PAS domain S-box-containing protein